jgi:hypothetical protein
MKKIVMMACVAALACFASCRDKQEPVPPTPPPAENPSADPAPAPKVKTTTTTTTVEEEKDGTSISIGNDGVDVSSKNGDDEKKFRISKKKSEVEIKTTE